MLTELEEGKVRNIIDAFDNGKSVTELNAATTLGNNDVMEVLQGGESKKVPVSVVKESVNSDVLTDLNKRGVFNVTVSVPLTAGSYYTLSTAIAAVPTASKSLGLDLKFSTAANTWVVYRYKGSDLTGWATTTNWEQVPDAAKLSSLETDLNKTLSLIDITNYALYVDTYTDKRYNPSTGVLEVSSGKNATSLCLVDKNNDICVGTNGYSTVCFYDKNKIFISSIANAYFARTILKSEIPSNCFYIAFSYTVAWLQSDTFYTRTTGDTAFGPKFYSTIKKIKGTRPRINIFLNDTQDTILRKLCDAILTGDCDVIFESGKYTFSQIYIDMSTVYDFGKRGGSYNRELPIGGNCRYYFNNSTVEGVMPVGIADAKVFGALRTGGNTYEIHDAIIVSNGMTYCVHDEGSASNLAYKHVYKNVKMQLIKNLNGIRCIGGGTNKFGVVVIDACVFISDNTNVSDVAYHGITTNITDVADFKIIMSNNWFSQFAQVNTLSENQTGNLIYCSNSAKQNPSVQDGWAIVSWGNETRS